MALIEIDGLPTLNMVSFHSYVSHNQTVYPIILAYEILGFRGQIPIFHGQFR